MPKPWSLCERVELHVEGRISSEDEARQRATASEILRRFERQPGVILADEVGMGKTFVALAVAVSVTLSDRNKRPVVVMVPSSLKEKWPKDFEVFRQCCLPSELSQRLSRGMAERPVEFLKLLDDPPERRRSLIFVTHGAMSRRLFDKWTKLALIHRAVKGRWGGDDLRRTLSRFLPDILLMKSQASWSDDVWFDLLKRDPATWLERFAAHGIGPEGRGEPEEADDPVPKAVLDVLDDIDTQDLYHVLKQIPKYRSKYYDQHIKTARGEIQVRLQDLWYQMVQRMKLQLPLVILDEAHHLKNPSTQLASLFQEEKAKSDADEITRGALSGAFERMLFLTATPFQLGHAELCSVLERFEGIAWDSPRSPAMSRQAFGEELGALRGGLDAAQKAALQLERAWGALGDEDIAINGQRFEDVEHWWPHTEQRHALSEPAKQVRARYDEAKTRMSQANELVRPWVIRHLRPRYLPSTREKPMERRRRLVGSAMVDPDAAPDNGGLSLNGTAELPFLLAARATTCAPESRPVFAEGLASSFEAFRYTRGRGAEAGVTDQDDDPIGQLVNTDAQHWYLDSLDRFLDRQQQARALSHPKVTATVNEALRLWRSGEKVLIFCHYVITGRVLRQRIAEAMDATIREAGAEAMGCAPEAVHEQLERLGDRFFDAESPLRRRLDAEIHELLLAYEALRESQGILTDVVRRYVRTPAFLVRYPLLGEADPAEKVAAAMDARDASGLSLRELIRGFFEFLAHRCTIDERPRYIAALGGLETGTRGAGDVDRMLSSEELKEDGSGQWLPNVRLVNGSTKSDTRQRLMLTFNTPFYPDVLVASSVMAEGVDLHLNCRHVIHHDLCWNPSTLEQRTGRIDRIGAKCERSARPIHVYLPYIGETQDEKMYRVVMDRERWFNVVMGESYRTDAQSTDERAARVPFPESAANALAFALGLA